MELTINITYDELKDLYFKGRIENNGIKIIFVNNQIPEAIDFISAMKKVCAFYGEEFYEVSSTKRYANLITFRNIFYNYLRNEANYSLKQIGTVFNNRNHATIIHGLIQYQRDYETNKQYRNLANNANKLLNYYIKGDFLNEKQT